MPNITATIIDCIGGEPAIKLIDKRFAKVIDWNIVENNSGVNNERSPNWGINTEYKW